MTDLPQAAMIFAAGFGTRMGELTRSTPKPMLPLAGRPMIDHAIDYVESAGIERIVANTHYLHDAIAPHLIARGITVLRESPEILDTGGGLKAARAALGDSPVITLNPDAAWTGPNPVETLLSAWRHEMRALLLLVPLETANSARTDGDFSLEQGEIRRKGRYLYTGAQIIRTDILDDFPALTFSLNEVWDRIADTGPLHGVVHDGGWCDIGHPEGLDDAHRMLGDV